MAGKRIRANGTWEYVFKKAGLLEKPIYMTFASEKEGDEYAQRLEALLDRGIIPSEHQPEGRILTIAALDREYQREAHPSPKDVAALRVIVRMHGDWPLARITAGWVDNWISEMKRVEQLAPATIRARVGALARCTDWGMRKGYVQFPDHPLRSLPDGYAQYTKMDAALSGGGRVDTERDRRLERGEYERILAVIQEGRLPRARTDLPYPPALECIFILAVETAMRLREMYTLTLAQVDLDKRTVFLEKTKNGDKRQVPLSSVAMSALERYLAIREEQGLEHDRLFPWWGGRYDAASLTRMSDFLSKLFKRIFAAAGIDDLNFHDLRHEATSRLFERTRLSETAIMRITGHKSQRMLMRYANLRGSDLADSLW